VRGRAQAYEPNRRRSPGWPTGDEIGEPDDLQHQDPVTKILLAVQHETDLQRLVKGNAERQAWGEVERKWGRRSPAARWRSSTLSKAGWVCSGL
jgi:hypothetical protein